MDYLGRVLSALRNQTLPQDQWELVVVDNASDEPLQGRVDLSWHSSARVIREEGLGLTPARLRGIRETIAQLLVFVDDDNVLDSEYLKAATEVAASFPQIGAFGGSIKGEFEAMPPDWMASYYEGLAVCELDRDYWSNVGGWSLATPYGAGLCVRRCVAEDYAKKVNNNALRRMLDRKGACLGAGGDGDLAWCAVDAGMGTGRFSALKLTHLIPKGRLTEEYIIRLYEGFAAADEILRKVRSSGAPSPEPAWVENIRFLWNYVRSTGIRRKILVVSRKAQRKTRQLLCSNLTTW
jgi:glycosyltransferase involved in cell wall biosynthesis